MSVFAVCLILCVAGVAAEPQTNGELRKKEDCDTFDGDCPGVTPPHSSDEMEALRVSEDCDPANGDCRRPWELPPDTAPVAAVAAEAATEEDTETAKLLNEAKVLETGLQQGGTSPKVAYLFLVKSGLPLANAWQQYFKGCPANSYSIVMHSQSGWNPPADLPVQMLKTVQEGDLRFTWRMNQAMWLLTRHALGDPQNRWMQFLSDGCAPIKTCAEFHQFMAAAPEQNFVGSQPLQASDVGRCYDRVSKRSSPDCLKSSQWVTLLRSHAERLINEWVPEQGQFWWGTNVPDEHAIPTIFKEKGVPMTGYTLTYVRWPNWQWPEPAGWHDTAGSQPQSGSCQRSDDSRPCDISLDDPQITNPNGHHFFARKVYPHMLQSSGGAKLLAKFGNWAADKAAAEADKKEDDTTAAAIKAKAAADAAAAHAQDSAAKQAAAATQVAQPQNDEARRRAWQKAHTEGMVASAVNKPRPLGALYTSTHYVT